ncbi:cell division protein FtsZ [Alphaproteobacteria bacterium]|nr:cell division protein FtsZ [Alphaproteobacteria bacterium]
MSIQLTVPSKRELKPRIVVFGVGGAGGNAVNNMISAGLDGVDFVVANTDAQALSLSKADRRIQMGAKLTEGLGAGSNPEVGQGAAEEALSEIVDILQGAHMVFVTAGMGGGTGTGAAPVIARAARENGILTVGVITKPFEFEGARRMRLAEAGIEALAREVDTLIIIPNQNLFRIANAQTTFGEAFAMADEVLHSGVAGITDLMIRPGLINLDFADVRSVMDEMGKAMMGTGESQGDNRAIEAAEAAISNPLLEDVSMSGAQGILINITGGQDMTLYEVDAAASRIRQEVDSDANIIIGSTFDEALSGIMRVSVVATGIEAAKASRPVSDEDRKVVSIARDYAEPIAQQAEEAPEQFVAEAPAEPEAAPVQNEAQLPQFITERPKAAPKREIPKRSQSFIERVFGQRKKTSEEMSYETQIDRHDPELPSEPQVTVSEPSPIDVSAVETPPAPVETPKPADAVASVPEPREAVIATNVSDKASNNSEDDDGLSLPSFPSRSAQASASKESYGQAEPVKATISQPAVAKASSASMAEPVSSTPVQSSLHNTVQTTMGSTNAVSSGFDSEQLDIPTFLRR